MLIRPAYHATIVKRIRQVLKIDHIAKMLIDVEDVGLPIAVVRIPVLRSLVDLSSDWGDPDCIKAHTLYVVEVLRDAIPAASTV